MIAGSEHANLSARADGGSVGAAAAGAVAGVLVLLVAVLLYLNRKRWWGQVARLACCPDEPRPQDNDHDHDHDHDDDDDDDDVHDGQPAAHRPSPRPGASSAISPAHHRNKLGKVFSFDAGDSSSETESAASGRPYLGAGRSPQAAMRHHGQQQDLMSLVERGGRAASSNSSCCSSTASEPPARRHHRQSAHRVATTDIRETKIDNYGDEHRHFQNVKSNQDIQEIDINSNRDCIVVMHAEPFESCDVQSSTESEPYGPVAASETPASAPGRCGHLELALLYDAPMRKMTVHVLQARDIPSRDRGQPTHTQVRLIMLPSKKQKHKTKIRSGDNPQYMESFLLHKVNPEDVNSMGLRFRVYGCERMRRERLIGEAVVSFAHMNLELENNLWLNLEPRANTSLNGCTGELMSLARSDSTSSTHSMQHGGVPELLLGLAYNATTGRLSVEVVKGSHFRNPAMTRAPDTYVKLSLVSSSGQQLARSKTSVRRGQPNPLFKETFVFQVALFQLADVTLMVSVYFRRGVAKRKEMLGWFSLGLSSSGTEQLAHWLDMKDLHQEQLCRWHVLLDS